LLVLYGDPLDRNLLVRENQIRARMRPQGRIARVLSDIVKRRSFRANAGIEGRVDFRSSAFRALSKCRPRRRFLRKQEFETRTASVDDA